MVRANLEKGKKNQNKNEELFNTKKFIHGTWWWSCWLGRGAQFGDMITHVDRYTWHIHTAHVFTFKYFDTILIRLGDLISFTFLAKMKKKMLCVENYLSELAELGGSISCFLTDADIFQNWNRLCENVQNNEDTFLHRHMIYSVAFVCVSLKEAHRTETERHFHWDVFYSILFAHALFSLIQSKYHA